MNECIRDAETGQPLKLTKAKWNKKEGRVNLDYRSIILMGTGAMSIAQKAISRGDGMHQGQGLLLDTNDDDNYDDDMVGDHDSDDQKEDHPLFRKFIMEGPLNPMAHQRWNPKTGEVDPDPAVLRREKRRLRLTMSNVGRLERQEDEVSEKSESPSSNGLAVAQNVLNIWQGNSTFLHSHREDKNIKSSSFLPGTPCSQNSAHSANKKSSQSGDSPATKKVLSRNASSSRSDPFSPHRSHSRSGKLSGKSSPVQNKRSREDCSVFSLLTESDKASDDSPRSNASTETNNQYVHEQLQKVMFNELFNKAAEIDRIRHPLPMFYNKTEEEKNQILKEDEARRAILVEHCKELAYMKARNVRDLKQALQDEEEREKKRQAHAAEWPPNSVAGKELRARHAEEREKARVYIETLQHDNEVLLILKMRQRKLLW